MHNKQKKLLYIKKKKHICFYVLNILWDEGYILGFKTSKINSNMYEIFLKYKNQQPCIKQFKFLSKPGNKSYYKLNQVWKINVNSGIILFSTNKGILTINDCKKHKLGGEPLILIK